MSNYEVLPDIMSDDGKETISASWTPNNGRRIQILNDDMQDWACFNMTKEQAQTLGEALLRWANDDHQTER